MASSGAEAIEVFLQAEEADVKSLLAEIKRKLPPYMVPRNIRLLRHLPLNANGKLDRGALLKKLEGSPA